MIKKLDFLIIGMFRSGTSFISNLINSHPKAYCVYDPYIFFIKIYNTFLNKNRKFNPDRDLDHYIKNKKIDNNNFIKKLASKKFDETISLQNKRLFKRLLVRFKSKQHKNIEKIRVSKQKQSYKVFFLDTLEQFKKINSKKKSVKIGTKISWCEEFIPVFFNSFKNVKIIFIYRDIKSIISSGIKSDVHGNLPLRPILYYVYYWKKSISFYKKYKKNILSVKYEDLILNYPKQKREIFKFLGLSNIKTKYLIDQFDKKWKANSSYKLKKKYIIVNTRNFYKKKLKEDLIQTINYLCKTELKYLGYIKKPCKKISERELIKCLKKHDKKKKIKKKYYKFLDYKKNLKNLI